MGVKVRYTPTLPLILESKVSRTANGSSIDETVLCLGS